MTFTTHTSNAAKLAAQRGQGRDRVTVGPRYLSAIRPRPYSLAARYSHASTLLPTY